jgi:hypothetical protein
MSPYYAKIVYRTNLCVIAYIALAWSLDRLSWPLAGGIFVYWLILPFAIVWSWPEHSERPLWGRTIFGALLTSLAAAIAIIVLVI